MINFLNILIGFIGGLSAAIGIYFGYIQYKKSKPNLILLEIHGSFKLSPEKIEHYSWRFILTFENRRNEKYSINEIYWTIYNKKLRKDIFSNSCDERQL